MKLGYIQKLIVELIEYANSQGVSGGYLHGRHGFFGGLEEVQVLNAARALVDRNLIEAFGPLPLYRFTEKYHSENNNSRKS